MCRNKQSCYDTDRPHPQEDANPQHQISDTSSGRSLRTLF